MESLKEISKLIKNMKSAEEVQNFMLEILTESEVATLSKRWRILKMLMQNETQRDIAKELKVSLCKVTRGSKILKNKDSIVKKYFKRSMKDDK